MENGITNGLPDSIEEWDEEEEEERPLSFWSRVRIRIGQFIIPDFYWYMRFKALTDVILELDGQIETLKWEVCSEEDHEGIRKVAAAQAGKEVLRALMDDQLYGAASGYFLHLRNKEEADFWLHSHQPSILMVEKSDLQQD